MQCSLAIVINALWDAKKVVESIGLDKSWNCSSRMFKKSSNCTYVRQNTGNCCRDDMLLETGAFKRTKQFRQAFLYHVTKTIRHLETNRNIKHF